jgi:lipopolysaccharide transport system ATP-binding protein
MAHISLKSVQIDIPIFNANGRSLTSRILETATGGRLDSDPTGRVHVRALDGVSLDIRNGERVAIVGHNGAGKSSLLRTLAGVYAPTKGEVNVDGSVASLIDLALGINPEATGRENIFIRGQLLGLSKSKIHDSFDEVVGFADLGDFIEMPVRTYSTGMHLRLAFAVSTLMRPEILLMDEWLSVGDSDFQQKAEERLATLVDESKILILATHSRELINQVCNRVIWLEHGRVKKDGPPETVLSEYFA